MFEYNIVCYACSEEYHKTVGTITMNYVVAYLNKVNVQRNNI